MCGINLIIDKEGLLEDGIHRINTMNETIIHRGPNNQAAIKVDGNYNTPWDRIFCGHVRLRIIDCNPRADQPFQAAPSGPILLFNGVIYNWHDLKNEMIGEETFSTLSDTETLYFHLKRNGQKGLARIEGMFSLVWIDPINNAYWVARDGVGMKPLYYQDSKHFLIISSETRGIQAAALLKNSFDANQVYHIYQQQHTFAPATIYSEIKMFDEGVPINLIDLKPNYAQSFTNNSPPLKTPRSKTPRSKATSSIPSLTDKEECLKNALQDSLLKHSDADSQIGLALSGGVDSTLLLALSKALNIPLHTYCMVSDEADVFLNLKDGKYASKAALQYHSSHHEISINEITTEVIDEYFKSCDLPCVDSGGLLTWYICKQVKNDCDVLWTGTGADEYFGGYNRHQFLYRFEKHSRVFNSLFKPLAKVFGYLPLSKNIPGQAVFRQLNFASKVIKKNTLETFSAILNMNEEDIKKQFHEKELHRSFSIDHVLKFDQNNYLKDHLLRYSDNASMAQSVELRLPYLDKYVISAANEFTIDELFRDGRKSPLKKLLKSYDGDAYCNRNKEGFGLPMTKWFNDPKLEALLFSTSPFWNFVEKKSVNKLLLEQHLGKQDHSLMLWRALSMSRWFYHHSLH